MQINIYEEIERQGGKIEKYSQRILKLTFVYRIMFDESSLEIEWRARGA